MSLNTIWQFATAGNLKFGRGARHLLVPQLVSRQIRRPLIVTDATLLEIEAVRETVAAVSAEIPNVSVFDACVPEPTVEIAEEVCQAARVQQADAIIGIGGGSNLDVAKIAATVQTHGGQPSAYFGFDRVPGPVLPVFAMPTTAGTGSEVSHSAVLTDSANQIKVSSLSRWLRPAEAIVDPALTDSCPPRVTGHSGIDALVHAIEAFTNRDFSEMCDVDPQARAYEGSFRVTRLLAAEAIKLVGGHLVKAYQHPDDTTARDGMALAATLAGMAFSNSGVGIVHALEYPIGALTHCSHGEGNGLLLPHVMRFNLESCRADFTEIARLLPFDDADGRSNGASADRSVEPTAEQAIACVERLQRAVGVTLRLRELGMKQADLDVAAAKSFEIKRLMDLNRRKPTVEALRGILAAAY